jgi:acetylornithine/succinyldiaminopimelate/putrescine aminotransferase
VSGPTCSPPWASAASAGRRGGCCFGRTGAWFASERFALDPDLMTTAKGLSSGYAPGLIAEAFAGALDAAT